jgi:UDP-N-acetylmuramoyl-tripeptide--D-alanyl-D-alanine ligase
MLELGPEEESFHESVGNSIDSNHIDYVFTYGRLGEHIAKGAKEVVPEERVFSFLDKEELLEQLKKYTNHKTLILVKGSRGMKLEEIVHGLQR